MESIAAMTFDLAPTIASDLPRRNAAGISRSWTSTVHIMFGFRTLDPDPSEGCSRWTAAVRVHPLSQSTTDPPQTRLVSPAGQAVVG